MNATYRFQSKASGDVLMLGSAGESVLRAMGIEPASKGILAPEAMPAAMRALEAAVASDELARAQAQPDTAVGEPEANGGEAVTLRQRAWPLIEMMRRAHAEAQPIVWGV